MGFVVFCTRRTPLPRLGPPWARAVALAKASRGRLTVLHVLSRAVPYVRELHLREQPRAAIRHEAQRRLDALLTKAMGTHGRTGLSRVVMGSVAIRVLSEAPCPVLTVRRR